MSPTGVGQVFAEIEAYARNCAFGDCEHRSEPGCAVQDAVVTGELDLGGGSIGTAN